MKTLAALALVPMLAGPALAGGYYYDPYYYKPVVKEKVVVVEKPVIVREAVSYLATIIPSPTYNITTNLPATPPVQQAQLTAQFGYNGAAAVTTAPAVAAVQTDALAAALEKINQRLCKLEDAAKVKPDNPFAVKAAPAAKCIACHGEKDAARLGGGFVFGDVLSPQQKLACIRKVRGGQMPPKDNKQGVAALTEQEKADLLDWLEK